MRYLSGLRRHRGLPAIATEEWKDKVEQIAIDGYYPVTLSSKTELRMDLEYYSFARNNPFFLSNFPVEKFNDYYGRELVLEGLVSVDAYGPADRSNRACYRRILKYTHPYKRSEKLDKKLWAKSLDFVRWHFLPIFEGCVVKTMQDALKGKDLSKSPGVMYVMYFKTKLEMYESKWGFAKLVDY